jgi:hypothetical protein
VFWCGFLSALKRRGLTGCGGSSPTSCRPRCRAQTLVSGHRPPTLPSPLRPQPMGALVQDAHRHGRRRVCTIFAQPDPNVVAATWDEVRDQLTRPVPEDRHPDEHRQGRSAGVPCVPTGVLVQASGARIPWSGSTRKSDAGPRVAGNLPNDAAVNRLARTTSRLSRESCPPSRSPKHSISAKPTSSIRRASSVAV